MHQLPNSRGSRKSLNNDAAWKAAVITYGIKTFATFVFSFLFFYIDSKFLAHSFSEGSHKAFLLAWTFNSNYILGYTWLAFGVNLIGGLVCYGLVFIVSHTNMQKGCLAIPLILSVPLTVGIAAVSDLCDVFINIDSICRADSTAWYFITLATAAITTAQVLSFGRYVFRKERMYLTKEGKAR